MSRQRPTSTAEKFRQTPFEKLDKPSQLSSQCFESRFGGKKEKKRKKKGTRAQSHGERSVWKENYPFSSFVPSSRRGIGEPSSHYERKRLVIPPPDAGKRWSRLKRRQANHLLDFPTRERRSDSKIFLSGTREGERKREREGALRTRQRALQRVHYSRRKGSTIKRCSHSKVFVKYRFTAAPLPTSRLKDRRLSKTSIVSFPHLFDNFQ